MIFDTNNNSSDDCGEQSSETYIEALDRDERQGRQAAYKGKLLDSDRHQTQDHPADANAAVNKLHALHSTAKG